LGLTLNHLSPNTLTIKQDCLHKHTNLQRGGTWMENTCVTTENPPTLQPWKRA